MCCAFRNVSKYSEISTDIALHPRLGSTTRSKVFLQISPTLELVKAKLSLVKASDLA
jgi:hypothetical protein